MSSTAPTDATVAGANARAFCERAIACIEVAAPDDAVARPLVGELVVAYVVVEGAAFRHVEHHHLAAAGLARDTLHAHAVANLRALAATDVEVRAYGGLFVATMGRHLEASLLLVDDFWDTWYAAQAPNGAVVAIPARDLLSFTDKASANGLRELDDLCTRAAGSMDHPLVDTLLERVDGRWQPFAPD